MAKLKYLPIPDYYLKDTLEFNKGIEPNPTKYSKVPDGIYHIRGDKNHYAKYYHVFNNVWYLMENKTKDNGHYYCEAATYELFPPLSEKEWDIMNAIPYKRLTKYWQRARYGYNFYMELRATSRRARLAYLKFKLHRYEKEIS